MCNSEWMARMLETQRVTFTLLDRIRQETGYECKNVTDLYIADHKDCPKWSDGKVEIGYNNDPESIAHEIGHGVHEKIRESGKQDIHGEEFADAIRYYVESDMNTNSTWIEQFDENNNPFTSNYSTVEEFIEALVDESLFGRVNWPEVC